MNAITTAADTPAINHSSLLMNPQHFEHVQRVARVYAMSPLFPEHLRKGDKETAIANAILVLNIADRLHEDALTVAQAIYFVSGRPGWSTSYCIAKVNQHGVFKNPIDWDVKGKGDTLSVTAYAEMSGTGKRVQATCDMAMAKAEGWTKNPKYTSMPEQMLRYRSATFLIRLYCPEILVGIPVQAEIQMEMRDITPPDYVYERIDSDGDEPDSGNEADAQEDTPHDPETGEVTSSVKPAQTKKAPDPEQFRGLLDMIKRDLVDAPSVDDVIDLYCTQIDQMKEAAPDLHKELEGEFAAYRAKEGMNE